MVHIFPDLIESRKLRSMAENTLFEFNQKKLKSVQTLSLEVRLIAFGALHISHKQQEMYLRREKQEMDKKQ